MKTKDLLFLVLPLLLGGLLSPLQPVRADDTKRQLMQQEATALDAASKAYDKGNLAEAEHQWRLALQLNPNDAEAIGNLGLIFYQRKDYKNAEPFMRKAMKLAPQNAGAANNLGILYLDSGKDPIIAEKLCRRATELDPKQSEWHESLAQCLLRIGKRDEAIEEAKKAIQLGHLGNTTIFRELGVKSQPIKPVYQPSRRTREGIPQIPLAGFIEGESTRSSPRDGAGRDSANSGSTEDKKPALRETLQWLCEKLNSEAHNEYSELHNEYEVGDVTKYTVTYYGANADANTGVMTFHRRLETKSTTIGSTRNIVVKTSEDVLVTISLGNLRPVEWDPSVNGGDEAFFVGLGVKDRRYPILVRGMLTRTENNDPPEKTTIDDQDMGWNIPFKGEGTARRVEDAFDHAITLSPKMKRNDLF